MGKRWIIPLALIAVVSAALTGFLARRNESQKIATLTYGQKVSAQELAPDTRAAFMGKSAIMNDAVAQQSIIETVSSNQMRVRATAYTNDPAETKDYAIGVTAAGSKTRDGVVAANFLPFGTKFMIPELYGDKVFTVEDRMNKKFNDQRIIDIWFPVKEQALTFGKKTLTLELL